MRMFKFIMIATLVVAMGGAAYAELQNVEVNGSIRIRGNYYEMDDGLVTGGAVAGDVAFWEQRTRLGVRADFTDEVSAYIEIDSYDVWGEEFRSSYVSGFDFRGDNATDVELYQSYIVANEMWGTGFSAKFGRQEMQLGSEWLAGNNDTASFFRGLSFDGVRLTYTTDNVIVDGWWTKLAESFDDFGDSDIDFYGIYVSYVGLEDIVIDGYWMFVRDDGTLPGVGGGVAPAGFDEADLHTIGLRGAGTYGAFDFEAEVAYQFGDVEDDDFTGPFGIIDFDDDLDYSALGVNLELGYTFDVNYQPRIYGGFAFFEGGDDDDDSIFDIFGDDEDELSFNRLFSDWEYSEFLVNTDLSNVFVYRLGLSVLPTESLTLALALSYFVADEEDDEEFLFDIFDSIIDFDKNADDELGFEVGLYADYQYTEDLVFRGGYAHFFGDDGTEDGNFVTGNGLFRLVDVDGDDGDYDYLFFETEIAF